MFVKLGTRIAMSSSSRRAPARSLRSRTENSVDTGRHGIPNLSVLVWPIPHREPASAAALKIASRSCAKEYFTTPAPCRKLGFACLCDKP